MSKFQFEMSKFQFEMSKFQFDSVKVSLWNVKVAIWKVKVSSKLSTNLQFTSAWKHAKFYFLSKHKIDYIEMIAKNTTFAKYLKCYTWQTVHILCRITAGALVVGLLLQFPTVAGMAYCQCQAWLLVQRWYKNHSHSYLDSLPKVLPAWWWWHTGFCL